MNRYYSRGFNTPKDTFELSLTVVQPDEEISRLWLYVVPSVQTDM